MKSLVGSFIWTLNASTICFTKIPIIIIYFDKWKMNLNGIVHSSIHLVALINLGCQENMFMFWHTHNVFFVWIQKIIDHRMHEQFIQKYIQMFVLFRGHSVLAAVCLNPFNALWILSLREMYVFKLIHIFMRNTSISFLHAVFFSGAIICITISNFNWRMERFSKCKFV